MKKYLWKTLSLLCALLLTLGCFSGCGTENTSSGSDAEDNPDEIVLKMTVLSDYQGFFEHAVHRYQTIHPNTRIEVNSIYAPLEGTTHWDALSQNFSKQMLGTGDDIVVIPDGAYTTDIYKMCLAGAFEDLTTYFEQADWNWEGYNKNVVDGMKMGENLFFVPLYYNIPVLIAEENALKASGMNLDACKTGVEQIQAMSDYAVRAAADPELARLGITNFYLFDSLIDVMAINPISWADRSLEWENTFQQVLDAYQPLYQLSVQRQICSIGWGYDEAYQALGRGEAILDADTPYMGTGSRPYGWNKVNCGKIAENGGIPKVIPVYTADGSGIAAGAVLSLGISNVSKYKKEAFEFIQFCLSREIQVASYVSGRAELSYAEFNGRGYIPIMTEAWADLDQCRGGTFEHTVMVGDESVRVSSGAIREQFCEFSSQVTTTYLWNSSNGSGNSVRSLFMDYLAGKKSYEECYQNANDKLRIYISE